MRAARLRALFESEVGAAVRADAPPGDRGNSTGHAAFPGDRGDSMGHAVFSGNRGDSMGHAVFSGDGGDSTETDVERASGMRRDVWRRACSEWLAISKRRRPATHAL